MLFRSLNKQGLGEIAPLPGLSLETLKEAHKQLESIRSFLLAENIPSGVEKLNGRLQEWLETFQLKPSVQFGIEMAILNLISHSKNTAMNKIISHEHHDHLRINALLQGSIEEVRAQAKSFVEQGFTALKLKVGSHVRSNIHEDIAKVSAVNEAIEGKALLHVDANQSCTLNEALQFGNEVGCAAVDYVEEPFKNLEDISEFFYGTTIPVALDESLRTHSLREVKSIGGVEIVVLKPTIIGGLEKTWAMIHEAHSYALEAVVSSSFESSLGISAIGNLAGSFSRDHTAGLDTLKWFSQDLLKKKITVSHGKMHVGQMNMGESNVDFSLLTKVG